MSEDTMADILMVPFTQEQYKRAKGGSAPAVMLELRRMFEEQLLEACRELDISYVRPQGRTMP